MPIQGLWISINIFLNPQIPTKIYSHWHKYCTSQGNVEVKGGESSAEEWAYQSSQKFNKKIQKSSKHFFISLRMVNSLPVVSQQQWSNFQMFTPLFIGSQDEIRMVSEEQSGWEGVWGTIGKGETGNLVILECGPKKYWVSQKAELDTECVCRKFTLCGSIPRNWSRRRKGITKKVGYEAKRHLGQLRLNPPGGALRSCGEYTSKSSSRRTSKKLSISFLVPQIKSCPRGCAWPCTTRIAHVSEQLSGFQKAS